MKKLPWTTVCFHFLIGGIYLDLLVRTAGAVVYNSTISCTRGADQSPYSITCPTEGGSNHIMIIRRVFYGATPLTRNCSRTAPYENCCKTYRDSENCVFENDADLESLSILCTGRLACSTSQPGKRPSSTLGNCSQQLYPALTSFSFVEYECVDIFDFVNLCGNASTSVRGVDAFIDVNTINVNTMTGDDCVCVVKSDCNTTLTFVGIHVQLHQSMNASLCSEDLVFEDMKNLDKQRSVSCSFDNDMLSVQTNLILRDKVLFVSDTNTAFVRLRGNGQATERILVRIKSSVENSSLHLSCGSHRSLVLDAGDLCPDDERLWPSAVAKMSVFNQTSSTVTSAGSATAPYEGFSASTVTEPTIPFSYSQNISVTKGSDVSSTAELTNVITNTRVNHVTGLIVSSAVDTSTWSVSEPTTDRVSDRAPLPWTSSAIFTTTTMTQHVNENQANTVALTNPDTPWSALYSGILAGVVLPIVFFAVLFCAAGVVWIAHPAKRDNSTITLHKDLVSQESLVSIA